jgi:hypothetical protein
MASLEHIHIRLNHKRECREQRNNRNSNNIVDLEQQMDNTSTRPSQDIELEDKSVTGTLTNEKYLVRPRSMT